MQPLTKEALEEISTQIEQALVFIGYDDCIIGVAGRCGMDEVLVYGYDLLIAKLVTQGMTPDEAAEYLEVNMAGAYMGDGTPLILRTE